MLKTSGFTLNSKADTIPIREKVRSYMSPSFTTTYCYLRKSRADGEETVEEVLSKHERIIQEYAVRGEETSV